MGYKLLYLVASEFVGDLIEFEGFIFVLFIGHGFFGDMKALIDPALSKNILLDGSIDE